MVEQQWLFSKQCLPFKLFGKETVWQRDSLEERLFDCLVNSVYCPLPERTCTQSCFPIRLFEDSNWIPCTPAKLIIDCVLAESGLPNSDNRQNRLEARNHVRNTPIKLKNSSSQSTSANLPENCQTVLKITNNHLFFNLIRFKRSFGWSFESTRLCF